ncbi:MAG: DNA sulfur modification protein DndB [Micromonosporaceae bacterium]
MTTPSNLEDLDLSAGHYVKGIPLTQTMFLAGTNFNQIRTITRNPVLLQQGARRAMVDDEIQDEAEIHDLIQRALSGSKKSNVPKYRDYICDVIRKARTGVLPPIHLWSQEQLQVVRQPNQSYVLVPNGAYLLAIDGETQLAAHWQLASSGAVDPETKQAHRSFSLAAIIHHDISVIAARQYFHDLNVLAVRPNTSLGLAMDTTDPIMKVVSEVEARVDFLHRRVDKQKRQLTKSSDKVVTLQNLRQMVVNIAKGISGIQYGARPAPVEDVDLADLESVAASWVGAYFNTFEKEITDRETYLASAGPVLAAVGAMGHRLLATPSEERAHLSEQLIRTLAEVDWRKGEHWIGIAGNVTSTGVFSVKGTKEVAYAVHNALTDRANGGYQRIRPHAANRYQDGRGVGARDAEFGAAGQVDFRGTS